MSPIFKALFVLGENASQCRSDDLEDLRERMKAVTGMVMVGGADDLLRVSSHKKKLEGVTQSMVDRFVCFSFSCKWEVKNENRLNDTTTQLIRVS